ncbi:glycosyltransferase family 4 protein [Mycobacterium sp. SMC-4]|uniref:glycosyltransferase family 4 protein n=1 Tax=Mycobacterium sp. SMC-4 TaxID=2857059 RepID=UPI003D083994
MIPKRILFVIRSYSPDQVGGGAKSVQTLAEGLAARGHDVHVLRLAPRGEESDYLKRAEEAGVAGPGKPQLHIAPLRNIHWPFGKEEHTKASKLLWHAIDMHNPWAALDVRRLLREIKPDIVNTSIIDGFSPSIWREIQRSGAKLIHTMRDYYLICARSSMYRNGRNCDSLCGSCKVIRTINRRRLRQADLLLANSGFVADTHKRFAGLPADLRTAVQWNVNERPIVTDIRSLWSESIVFGYIGRLAPTKGVDILLDAVTQMPADGRNWSLLIAGDGPSAYVEKLKASAEALPNVKFLGWTAPEEFYAQIDVLVCPSVYNEPLPRVIYEAYGFAIPVIASRVGGHPEIVTDGDSGRLYKGDDSRCLAECMQTFRNMPHHGYQEYSAGALLHGQKFTPAAVLDSFEDHMAALFARPEDVPEGGRRK